MSNTYNAIPIKRGKSWAWIGMVLFLMGIFAVGQPMGQAVLEAVGIQSSQWREMSEDLSGLVASYEGEVGIYIKDLGTGRTIEMNADENFISASLIKLPIMAAVFQAIHDNKFSLHSMVPLKSRHRRGGSGTLRWTRNNTQIPVSHLIYRMITESDNTAAAILIDKLGYPYLNQCFRGFNLATTRIDPVGMKLNSYIQPSRDNYTTPREMGGLLEKIYNRKMVSNGLSDLMLETLKRADAPTRLAEFLPSNWILARKTGLLRKNCHDVGIVFTENGDYVICVLTRKNRTYKSAKILISHVGKTAYSYLGHS